jgi:hypothetical protein
LDSLQSVIERAFKKNPIVDSEGEGAELSHAEIFLHCSEEGVATIPENMGHLERWSATLFDVHRQGNLISITYVLFAIVKTSSL